MSIKYVVDQGGASFTVHLYILPPAHEQAASSDQDAPSPSHGIVVQHFSEKARTLLRDIDGHPALKSYLEAHPFVDQLVDRVGGTFEDYSGCDPARYGEVADFLALCYKTHLVPMVEAHCPSGTVAAADVQKIVRQTGKIRAKLLQDSASAREQRSQWYAAMRSALGEDWDYALIPTAAEARLEGTSFFRLNDLSTIAPHAPTGGAGAQDSVAGIGVGSSSTQLYALDGNGKLQVSFDPFLGCKPTAAEKEDADDGRAKSADAFRARFSAVFGTRFQGGAGAAAAAGPAPGASPPSSSPSPARLLYCHGAFGYVVNELFGPGVEYAKRDVLLAKIVAGAPIPVEDFHAACSALTARPGNGDRFEANLLAGFSAALAAVAPGIRFLMVKAKPNKKYGVHPEPSADLQLSWVRAGVFFGFGDDDDDDDNNNNNNNANGDSASGEPGAPPLPRPSSTDGEESLSPEPLVVGLTGGIASGKSTLMRFLREQRGCPTVDADKLGHACYTQGTGCYRDIVNEFGNKVVAPDGSIDRRALGGIVFSSKDRMKALCDITWPHIRQRIVEEVATVKSNLRSRAASADQPQRLPRFIFVEAAVLVEAGWMDAFDEVWVVTVPEEVACHRLMARNNLDRQEALKRIRAQITTDERVRHATRVLAHQEDDGDDDGAAFHERVAVLMDTLVARGVSGGGGGGGGGTGQTTDDHNSREAPGGGTKDPPGEHSARSEEDDGDGE